MTSSPATVFGATAAATAAAAAVSDTGDATIKRTTKTIRPKSKKEKPTMNVVSDEAKCEEIQVYEEPVDKEQPVYCDPELFVKRQIRRTISIPFYRLTTNTVVTQLLRNELAKLVEGRCSIEGYICPNSVAISSYSCGTLSGANIHFDVIADCLICYPDENTVIRCAAKTITQAGIRAGATKLECGKVSPIEVFLSRDMHASSRELFSCIEENDILTVKIIGRRFVLHDTHVTIIAMLLNAEKGV
jgi:hypothetical protein